MERITSILVDIDVQAQTHPALERAVRLARRSGARLTVTDVLTVPPYARHDLPPKVEEEMVADRRRQLERMTRAIPGVDVEARLLTGRPGTAIVREVLRAGHDLLMRSHDRDLATAPRPFGPVDMELLRKCPCPVLLVRQGAGGAHPRMVAAINSSTDEESEHALNRKIVEITLRLAELEEGLPILLQAWAPFAEGLIRDHSSADDFAAYVSGVRDRTAADLRRFVQSVSTSGVPIQTVHRRGEPEDVIPEFVVSQGIDLVVMGTVARSGIAGLFIGNTAERVLRKLPCSVLAVKPDGFVSPERLEGDDPAGSGTH